MSTRKTITIEGHREHECECDYECECYRDHQNRHREVIRIYSDFGSLEEIREMADQPSGAAWSVDIDETDLSQLLKDHGDTIAYYTNTVTYSPGGGSDDRVSYYMYTLIAIGDDLSYLVEETEDSSDAAFYSDRDQGKAAFCSAVVCNLPDTITGEEVKGDSSTSIPISQADLTSGLVEGFKTLTLALLGDLLQGEDRNLAQIRFAAEGDETACYLRFAGATKRLAAKQIGEATALPTDYEWLV